MEEIWKDAVKFEGYYQVSNTNKVKSLARMRKSKGGCLCPVPEKILTNIVVHGGYLAVLLKKNWDKKRKTGVKILAKVHTLVLEAFVGPRPEGAVCRHLNGDARDNRPENLVWGTHKQNSDDR